MNEELKELHEAKYSLNRQIQATQESRSVHYTNIKREEVKLISLQYELKQINEKIYKVEQTNKKEE